MEGKIIKSRERSELMVSWKNMGLLHVHTEISLTFSSDITEGLPGREHSATDPILRTLEVISILCYDVEHHCQETFLKTPVLPSQCIQPALRNILLRIRARRRAIGRVPLIATASPTGQTIQS